MKFSFKPKDVLTELKLVAGSLGNGNTLPVLANFLIKLEQDTATITASDMETQMTVCVAVKVDALGAVTLPAKKFIEICSAVPANSVMTVTVKNERVVLQSGRSRFTLSTLPVEHFASMGETKDAMTFKLPANDLLNCLENVSHAMAKNDVRYYLNGMLFEIKEASFRCVATDGHRLAMGELQASINIDDVNQVIIPRKSIGLITKVIHLVDEVSVSVDKNLLSIRVGDACMITKLIDGKYPRYEKIIPKTNKKLRVDGRLFIAALQRANILTSRQYRAAKLVLADNTLRIEVVNDQGEKSTEALTADFNGSIEMGMNVTYLIDALAGCASDDVCLAMSEHNRGVVIQGYKDDNGYRCIIMPTRL